MAIFILGAKMNEPVQNATFRIEPRDDFVKVSGILKLVSTPNSPSDKIGNLDNPRILRINAKLPKEKTQAECGTCPQRTVNINSQTLDRIFDHKR